MRSIGAAHLIELIEHVLDRSWGDHLLLAKSAVVAALCEHAITQPLKRGLDVCLVRNPIVPKAPAHRFDPMPAYPDTAVHGNSDNTIAG